MVDEVSNGYGSVPSNKLLFEDFQLSQALLKGLYVQMRYERPTEVQATLLSLISSKPHRNLIAEAPMGSGKSLDFVLGMLMRIEPTLMTAQALCLCPSRLLANQLLQMVRRISKYTPFTATGASAFSDQDHVLIGTPDSVVELIACKKLCLSKLKMLVFDEGDQLLAEGFRDLSLKVLRELEKANPSIHVCSDSYEELKAFSRSVIKKANTLCVGGRNKALSASSVKQFKVVCPTVESKIRAVTDLIMEAGDIDRTLVFVRDTEAAFQLHRALNAKRYDIGDLHIPMSEPQRDQIVEEFQKCLTTVLIVTDVFARGFDHPGVNLVVNLDLPVVTSPQGQEPEYEVFLHRAGRCGRFGRKGAVFNLIVQEDLENMQKIEEKFGFNVTEVLPWDSEE